MVEKKDDEPKEKKKKSDVVTILQSRDSNNVNIMLSRMKDLSFKQIKDAIMQLDEKVLTIEDIHVCHGS